MPAREKIAATLCTFSIVLTGCASNSSATGNGGGGGCMSFVFVLFIVGAVCWTFSTSGQYQAGFRDGKTGKPKNVHHRFLGDQLKKSYSEGYRDGQFSNIRDQETDRDNA